MVPAAHRSGENSQECEARDPTDRDNSSREPSTSTARAPSKMPRAMPPGGGFDDCDRSSQRRGLQLLDATLAHINDRRRNAFVQSRRSPNLSRPEREYLFFVSIAQVEHCRLGHRGHDREFLLANLNGRAQNLQLGPQELRGFFVAFASDDASRLSAQLLQILLQLIRIDLRSAAGHQSSASSNADHGRYRRMALKRRASD